MAHAGGRPTKYSSTSVDQVYQYLEKSGKHQMHLPKMQSLAIFMGVDTDTLVEWGKKYPEFSVALKGLMALQAEQLIDDGIYGGKAVNSTIVKLLLQNNHGLKERADVTSDDKELKYPTVFIPKEIDG